MIELKEDRFVVLLAKLSYIQKKVEGSTPGTG